MTSHAIPSLLALLRMPGGVRSGKRAVSSSAVAVGYFSRSTASSSFVHLIVGWSSRKQRSSSTPIQGHANGLRASRNVGKGLPIPLSQQRYLPFRVYLLVSRPHSS